MAVLAHATRQKSQTYAHSRRWSDKDPTLSMAISLLQNLPLPQQEELAYHMLTIADQICDPPAPQEFLVEKSGPGLPVFLQVLLTPLQLPSRRSLEKGSVKRLLEQIRPLPKNQQLDMAMRIINAAYWFDLEGDLNNLEEHWGHELISRTAFAT